MTNKEAFEKMVELCTFYHHAIVKDADIEFVCDYRIDNIIKDLEGVIFKIPNEFIVLRKGAKIVSAFPKKKSPCLDYIGILPNGKSIVFEAKTTANKTSFPLSNRYNY